MSAGHARLSASSGHRWLRCAGSVELSEGLDKPSIYAAAGTYAHSIAAECLQDIQKSPSDWLLKKATIDGFEVECDLEMIDAVGLYLDTVLDDEKPGDETWVEMSLEKALRLVHPDMGGTADHVRYRPSTKSLRVSDFKFGSGTYVEADDNEQMKLYALGVMLQIGRPVVDVELVIVQPRFEGAKPVRTWCFKGHEILNFSADAVDAGIATRLPNPPLVAGEHCKFCPAARTCPELEKKHHALVAAEFDVAGPITPSRLASALVSIPLVKERIKAIEEYAYAEALKGVEIPGFKLVDKIAHRKWKSEGEVILWAEAQAIDPYAPREVISPAQLEKKLAATAPKGKKKEAGKVLEPFVERISSGTALVPVTDARQPHKLIAATDFELLK